MIESNKNMTANEKMQNKKPIINKIKSASITNENAKKSLNKYFL